MLGRRFPSGFERRFLSGFERSIYDRNDCYNFNFWEYSAFPLWCGSPNKTQNSYIRLICKLVKTWPSAANEAAKYIRGTAEEFTTVEILKFALQIGNFKFIVVFLSSHPETTNIWINCLAEFTQLPNGKCDYRAATFLAHKYIPPKRKNVILNVAPLSAFDLLMLMKQKQHATYDSILYVSTYRAQIIRKMWESSWDTMQKLGSLGTLKTIKVLVSLFHVDTTLLLNISTTVEELRLAAAKHHNCSIHCVNIFHRGTRINGDTTEIRRIYNEPTMRNIYIEYTSLHPFHCSCNNAKTHDELQKKFPSKTADPASLKTLSIGALRDKLRALTQR